MPRRKGNEQEGSSSGSKPPPRGRNAYIKPPQRPEDRPVLHRSGFRAFVGDLLTVTKNVNKIISQCARLHYPEETRLPEIHVCTCFTDYPEETKLKVHDDFLTHYQFPTDENMDLVWKTFERIANKAIQNLLNKCRDVSKNQYGDNILEWKARGVPNTYDWITANNWLKLCDYWCTEAFAKRSERNQQNRTASGESAFATTGSVNMLVHKQKFEIEKGHEPKWSELFTPTHTNKKGQFCSAKAKKAHEDYDRDMTEKYGPDRALWPSFDEDVWYSNTDNNAHGDNYGLGALGKTRSMYRPGGFQTSSSQSQSQSYSSAPPPLNQEYINAISGQVLVALQPQMNVFNEFMEEMRRSMGHSGHQGGSSSHHPSIPDAQDDDEDDVRDHLSDDDDGDD